MAGVGRREALRAVAAGLAAGLAGCSGLLGDGGDQEGDDPLVDETPSAVPTDETATADSSTDSGPTDSDQTDDGTAGGPGSILGAAGSWNLPLHDARNTSLAAASTGIDGGISTQVIWAQSVPDGYEFSTFEYAPPAVWEGTAVSQVSGTFISEETASPASRSTASLVALDLSSWDVVWERSLPQGAAHATPAVVADGVVVHLGESLTGRAIDDGSVHWTNTDPEYTGTPLTVAGDTVLLRDAQFTLSAVALADGSHRWSSPVEGVRHTPAVADGTVFVTVGEELVALDVADGSERWRRGHDAFQSLVVSRDEPGPLGPPVVTDDAVFAAAGRPVFLNRDVGGLVAFERSTGEQRWAFDFEEQLGVANQPPVDPQEDPAFEPHGLYGAPAVADGTLYVNARVLGEPRLFAVDAATGDLIWDVPTEGAAMYAPATGETVTVVSEGHVEVFDRADGRRRGHVAADGAAHNVGRHPALAGDTVVATSRNGIHGYRGAE